VRRGLRPRLTVDAAEGRRAPRSGAQENTPAACSGRVLDQASAGAGRSSPDIRT